MTRVSILLAALGAAPTLAPMLAAQEPDDWAFLGLMTESIKAGDDASGLRVTYVFPTSAAEQMGLRSGDEIFALNDIIIESLDAFMQELKREKVDATVRFLVRRDGEKDLLKLSGKIGSYEKTMGHLQNVLRERLLGKPLPELPPIRWWDPATKGFVAEKDLVALAKGKVTILFGCNDFVMPEKFLAQGYKLRNYRKFSQMAALLKSSQPDAPIRFVGLYRDDRQAEKGDEAILAAAKAHFEKLPPPFPVGVALFPRTMTDVDRENLFFIRNQGVAMLGPSGNVDYLQVLGLPEQEFFVAFQKLLQAMSAKPKPEPEPQPEPAPEDEGAPAPKPDEGVKPDDGVKPEPGGDDGGR